MTKKHPPREEPKLRMDDFEDDDYKTPKKKWPTEDELRETSGADEVQEAGRDDIAGVLEHPSYKELENKLTETEEKLHECMMRAEADKENLRRRCERDVANAYKFSTEKLISELFQVVDSLERALESKVDNNEYAMKIHEGIELTMTMFLKVLEKSGVKQIDPIGDIFNPDLHQAISTQPAEGVADNTIVGVLQKGYTLNDRLLRPALVVVAKS